MQGADEVIENQSKSRIDEESINFRPSPNFKHMRKYLKSKFEEANQMMTDSSSNFSNGGASSSTQQQNLPAKVIPATNVPVQPPLPPNPPPPDSPPLITNLKKEIDDDDYQCSASTEAPAENNAAEQHKAVTVKTDQPEPAADKPKVTMCRNFVRGTCKKGATCIFVHELILSQLPGVYTFCRNFQNSVCSFPKCKFVHATVFEKEYFFRTGYLPPHTLAHLKEASTVLQPPPPPPQPEEPPAEVPQVYAAAAPPPAVPCIPPVVPVYNPVEAVVERTEPNFAAGQLAVPSSSSPKHLRDHGAESLSKKCKNCEDTSFRVQSMRTKVENFAIGNRELNQKIQLLNRKNAKWNSVLTALFKNRYDSPSSSSGMSSVADSDTNVLSNSNVTALLVKMLLNAEAPPDKS